MNEATDAKLKKLGEKLRKTDHMLVHLMFRRIQLAQQVAIAKLGTNEPTFRPEIENKRLQEIRDWALKESIDPHFAAALLYFIIGESHKQQGIVRDLHAHGKKFEDYTPEVLRRNLLKLTSEWAATYDLKYGQDFFATKLHLDFEHRVLMECISHAPRHGALVELGCATGREITQQKHDFTRVIGYDVCPTMVAKARENAAEKKMGRLLFEVCDLENGIPLKDESVSFIFMNQGTGSEIANIKHLLSEINRVLVVGGGFFLSFYNTQAIVNKTFLPWPLSLNAEFDYERNILMVGCGNGSIPIFAKTYDVDGLSDMMPKHLNVTRIQTHPVMSAILPNDVFVEPAVQQMIEKIDADLANSSENLGAYITISGTKH